MWERVTPETGAAPPEASPFSFLANWRGGLAGILTCTLVSILLFFIAFMVAFGNDTPGGRLSLAAFEIYATLAHPLWMIPISYAAGARWILRSGK
jgi:predicted lipid-binding transport protein (Tim44 family)